MNLMNALKHINFIHKKPLVAVKVFKGYFNGLLLDRPVLRTVDFAMTNLCNSRCKMCSAHLLYKQGNNKDILSPEEVADTFLQASKLGAMHINLTGGEPLMRPLDELIYIVSHIRPRFHVISIVTNSLLITREKLVKLKKAGVDTVQFSLESLDPEVNDEIRGVKGNLAKTMEAFYLAKELGFIICLTTVLSHNNFEEIKRIIAFAKEKGNGKIFVLLNPISASGAVVGKVELKLTDDDLDKYNKLLRIGIVRADTIFNFSGRGGCPGGKERIHITAFGDVITCPHVQISYGNVKKEPLKEIWGRMHDFSYLKAYSKNCKHVFDKEYNEKFLKPIENIKNVPISIMEHPVLKDEYKEYIERRNDFIAESRR